MTKKQTLTLIIIALAVLIADRLTKFFVIKKLLAYPGVLLFDKPWLTLSFFKSFNQGLAFSIPVPQILTIIITSSIIGLLLYLFIKKFRAQKFWWCVFIELIALSAISNLFDRIYYGGVVDFISVKIFNFNWAIFNFADAFILAGVVGLLIVESKGRNERQARLDSAKLID